MTPECWTDAEEYKVTHHHVRLRPFIIRGDSLRSLRCCRRRRLRSSLRPLHVPSIHTQSTAKQRIIKLSEHLCACVCACVYLYKSTHEHANTSSKLLRARRRGHAHSSTHTHTCLSRKFSVEFGMCVYTSDEYVDAVRWWWGERWQVCVCVCFRARARESGADERVRCVYECDLPLWISHRRPSIQATANGEALWRDFGCDVCDLLKI